MNSAAAQQALEISHRGIVATCGLGCGGNRAVRGTHWWRRWRMRWSGGAGAVFREGISAVGKGVCGGRGGCGWDGSTGGSTRSYVRRKQRVLYSCLGLRETLLRRGGSL
jgi:hypothetical protein